MKEEKIKIMPIEFYYVREIGMYMASNVIIESDGKVDIFQSWE